MCVAFAPRSEEAVQSESADPMLALMAYIFGLPLEVKPAKPC